jgi:hypothetical protein
MAILNFDNQSGSNSRRPLKVILGIGALAAVVTVASTLAANIRINSGPVEFGQGVAQTTSCDDQITVTPYSTFINDSSTGSHMLTSIKIGGIDSSEDKCAGKTFVVKAYGDDGLLPLFNWENNNYDEIDNPDRQWRETERYDFVEVRNDVDEFTWTSGGTDHDDVFSETSDVSDTSFTLNLVSRAYEVRRNPLALATSVKRVTVETRDTLAVDPVALCEELGGVVNQQSCEVDSSAIVYNSITIPTGFSLALSGELTITIESSVKVTNNGMINISGENVVIDNFGIVVNNGTIDSDGVINNYRTIDNGELFFNNSPTGTINNELGATFINDGQVLSNHQINNYGFFNNSSSRTDAVYLGDLGVIMNFCPYEWAGPVPTGSGQYVQSCT